MEDINNDTSYSLDWLYSNIDEIIDIDFEKEEKMMRCKGCVHFDVCGKPHRKIYPDDEKLIVCCEHYIPAADVVEVVRCKDCVHYSLEKGYCEILQYESPIESGYCCYGVHQQKKEVE